MAAQVVESIAEGCRQAGAALIGGETAEMPGMYTAKDYDLAGFCVGAAERGTLLPKSSIARGDICSALRDRRAFERLFPRAQNRKFRWAILASQRLEPSRTLGEALLTPTRIYVKPRSRPMRRAGEGLRAYHRRRTAGQSASCPAGKSAAIDLRAIKPHRFSNGLQPRVCS